jgi:hypothetical protein
MDKTESIKNSSASLPLDGQEIELIISTGNISQSGIACAKSLCDG